MDEDDRLQTRPYELGRTVRLYPEPEEVFADPVDRHARHLHPMASIDLTSVSPELSGWIHLVLPIDPYAEYLGSYTQPFHDERVTENWISFEVVDGRYRFLGDFRYFFTENDDLGEPYANHRRDLEAHYVTQQASYEEYKQRVGRDGWKQVRADGTDGPLHQFRERPWNANWAVHPPPPGDLQVVTSGDRGQYAGLATSAGRELIFVASAEGFRYRRHGPDEVLLFFDPVEQVAVQTFDWG